MRSLPLPLFYAGGSEKDSRPARAGDIIGIRINVIIETDKNVNVKSW